MVTINRILILAVVLFIAISLSLSADVVSSATSTSSTTKVTVSQLNTASNTVNNYYKKYKKLPQTVTINKKKVTMYQYYYLLATGTSQLSAGNKNAITLKNVKAPTGSTDTRKKGSIKKTEYVKMAKSVKKFVDTNGRAPSFVTSSKGKIKFEAAVENYNRIILFYKNKKRLPTYVTATKYTGKAYISEGTATPVKPNPTARPVYIVSDRIYNTATDNAMINTLITELKKYGVKAINYGLGPNKHWDVMLDKSVPKNALIVEIFGGACAATIRDLGTSSYKHFQSTKKVYAVFTNGAAKITNLAFLPRAPDDNFSPETFKGLATPDKYLLSNGIKFTEGYTNSKVTTLAQILAKEALS